MTTVTSQSQNSFTILRGKSRLWWFGLVILELGILFWVTVLNEQLTIQLLDLLTSSELINISHTEVQTMQFLAGLSGAVMAAWGITIMAVATQFTRDMRTYLIGALVIWYVLDSGASLLTGYGINALLNLGFLLIGIGLALTTPLKEIDGGHQV